MVTPTRTWQYKRHTGQNNISARPLQNNNAKSPKFVWFENGNPDGKLFNFPLVLNAAAHIRYAEVEVWRCKRSHARHSDWNINKYSNRHLPQRSHLGYYITSVWRWGVTESWGAPDGWNTIGWGSVRDSSHVPGTISRTETFGVWSNFLRF